MGPHEHAGMAGTVPSPAFVWHEEIESGLRVAFTGASAGNLALHAGADPGAVLARRRALEEVMGIGAGELAFMQQTHSAVVADADGFATTAQAPQTPPADAIVSPDGGTALAVMVADCVPIVLIGRAGPADGAGLADGQGERYITAAVHAGREGLLGGVVVNAVNRMRSHGAQALRAWIGPSICGGCYEVPPAMHARASALVPECGTLSRKGTTALDLRAGASAQLQAQAVDVKRIDLCTAEDERLYSYRRNQATGRFVGLVWRDGNSRNGVGNGPR